MSAATSAFATLLALPPPSSGGHGSKSPVVLLIVGLLFIAVGGLQAMNPRALWRLNRWRYKNPDANEPSEKGFLVMRVAGGIAAIFGVILVVIAITKF